MSLSRKNWSALSSLAQQRTLEDEEEIVREQRRRNRNQSSSTDTRSDLPPSLPTEVEHPDIGGQSARGRRLRSQRSEVERPALERMHSIEESEPPESLGPDDDESKFLEILRSRETRRQRRQVEILEQLKQEHQNGVDPESRAGEPRTTEPAQQLDRATECNKEKGKVKPKTTEPPQQPDCAIECNKEKGKVKPRTAEPPQQPDRAIECDKEKGKAKPRTAEPRQQQNRATECDKDRGETPPPKGSTIKEAILLPKSTGGEQRSAERTCLQISKAAPTKPGGNTSQTSTFVPTSLSGSDRSFSSTSPTSSSSTCLPNSSDGASRHVGNYSNDEPNRHDEPSSHDRTKSSNGPTSLDEPTSLDVSTSLPSSTSPSVSTRPERKAVTKRLIGPTSPDKSSDHSASVTSAPNAIKPKSPTQSMTPTGPTSHSGLTSSTTSPMSPSQKYKSQVFVSSIKITRNKSFDDTEGNQVKRLSTDRFVEKITESKTEVDGVKSPTEKTPVVEKEETLQRNQARQSLKLHISPSGEDKKDVGSDEKPPPSSPEGPAGAKATPPGPTASGTGLTRFSPRTSSVRVTSWTEQSASPFTRSASLRIPSRNFKLDAKLERYAEALQKSETVKSPTQTTKEFFASPEGVASKRSLFERDAGGSGANTPTSRKDNLSLTGAVSSRINHWINKTQGEASSNSGAKDAKKVDIASKRSLWEQRSLATDTKP